MDEEQGKPTTKRRRIRAALSCVNCQARKIKCSRTCPCENCIQRGMADSCHWESTEEKRARANAERWVVMDAMAFRRRRQRSAFRNTKGFRSAESDRAELTLHTAHTAQTRPALRRRHGNMRYTLCASSTKLDSVVSKGFCLSSSKCNRNSLQRPSSHLRDRETRCSRMRQRAPLQLPAMLQPI